MKSNYPARPGKLGPARLTFMVLGLVLLLGTSATGCGSGGGSGGSGGGMPCITPQDCPPPADHCVTATCLAGKCGTAVAASTTCDDGNACTVGDTCQAGICTGSPKV